MTQQLLWLDKHKAPVRNGRDCYEFDVIADSKKSSLRPTKKLQLVSMKNERKNCYGHDAPASKKRRDKGTTAETLIRNHLAPA